MILDAEGLHPLRDLASLLEPWPVPSGQSLVVSLVGAGGKTTLLFALAHLLEAEGHRVVTTTTTKIFPPLPEQSSHVLWRNSCVAHGVAADSWLAELRALLDCHRHVTVVEGQGPMGKLQGLSLDHVDALAISGVADVILVEADGASMRPLKAPAAHEPAVPAATHICCALWHVRALGQRAERVVHRPEKAFELCGLAPEHKVELHHVVPLMLHAQGHFRTTLSGARQVVLCVGGSLSLVQEAAVLAQALYPQSKALWWLCEPCQGWAVPAMTLRDK